MKKKISLVLAFLMAATMLAGCKKTDEETAGLPEVATTTAMSELTQMTVAETEATTVPEVTTTEATTTTEAETTTEATTVSAEAEEATTTAASETEASETTTAKPTEWSETEISETLYVVSNCYSRVKAVVGSESVKAYKVGTEINIVAATDTGYYKLADGTFIHSDYVSDQKPSVTAKVEDDDDSSSEKKPSSSSKPSKISSTYKKSYEDRYPYQQLSADEKQLYRNFVESAYAFDPKVEVPDGLLYEDIFKVYSMVFSQEPQLFWLPSSAPKGYGSVTVDYAFSQSEVEAIQEEIDDVAKDVMGTKS